MQFVDREPSSLLISNALRIANNRALKEAK